MATNADTSPEASDAHRRRRTSTIVFAGATLLSRIAGMARQVGTAWLFGVNGGEYSAFTIASQIPNLIRSLVADSALGAAFVPIFTELREQGDEARAWRVASAVTTWIIVLLGPLCVVCMIFAPLLVDPFFQEGNANYDLTVQLTRILVPVILLMALSGVVVGILNSYDHFASPALAPVAWNFVILLGLVVAAAFAQHDAQIYIYTVAVLVGTVVQVAFPAPWLRGRGGRLSWTLDWRDPKIFEIVKLMLPVTIGLGLINLQLLLATGFANNVPFDTFPAGVDGDAGPAVLDNAFRLYMLPQGVFSVAVSVVFYPALARFAARVDMEGFRHTFADGLRQIIVTLVPAAAFLALLAEPVVRLLLQHGDFTAPQTTAVADTLVMMTIGLVLNGASLLLIRSFFSLKRPWLPTAVSVFTLATNVAFILMLYQDLGVRGIALATSIVNILSFIVMYALLHVSVGALGTRRSLLTAAVAAGAALPAAWIAARGWDHAIEWLGDGIFGQIGAMAFALIVAYGIYLVIIARLQLIDPRLLRVFTRRTEER